MRRPTDWIALGLLLAACLAVFHEVVYRTQLGLEKEFFLLVLTPSLFVLVLATWILGRMLLDEKREEKDDRTPFDKAMDSYLESVFMEALNEAISEYHIADHTEVPIERAFSELIFKPAWEVVRTEWDTVFEQVVLDLGHQPNTYYVYWNTQVRYGEMAATEFEERRGVVAGFNPMQDNHHDIPRLPEEG